MAATRSHSTPPATRARRARLHVRNLHHVVDPAGSQPFDRPTTHAHPHLRPYDGRNQQGRVHEPKGLTVP